jgi:hypothetical protein
MSDAALGPTNPKRTYKAMAAIGWICWLVSLITPDLAFSGIGAYMFWLAPVYGVAFLGGDDWHTVLTGACFILGFLSNVTLFVWVPRWAAMLAIAAPWLSFAASYFIDLPNASEATIRMLFFYPWALGIGLVHLARVLTQPYPRSARP